MDARTRRELNSIAIVVADCIVSGADETRPVIWWSYTKTILAWAVLVLVRDGRLMLDAPYPGRNFTLAEVLQHRGGLPDYGAMLRYRAAVEAGDTPWSRREFLARTAPDILCYPARGEFSYSNIGYMLVTQLIEETTGVPLAKALENLVFTPLEISGVDVALKPADLTATLWGNGANYHPGWVAHGLLTGTPAAAALLLHRMMSGKHLPPELLARACRGLPVSGPWSGRPWRKAAYGFGLMIDEAGPLGRQLGHTGQGHTSAAVYHFPDLDPPRTVATFNHNSDADGAEWSVIEVGKALC